MPGIQELPTEILLRIFSYLTRLESRGDPASPQQNARRPLDILALCLTCRRFQEVASELLATEWSSIETAFLRGRQRSILSLVRQVLLRQPGLASKVRYLGVGQWFVAEDYLSAGKPGGRLDATRWHDDTVMSAEEKSILEEVIRKAWPELNASQEEAEMPVKPLVEDDMLALLLQCLPALKELELVVRVFMSGRNAVWKHVFERTAALCASPQYDDAGSLPSAYHGLVPSPDRKLGCLNLRRVSIRYGGAGNGLEYEELIPFFNLPNLRELYGGKICSEGPPSYKSISGTVKFPVATSLIRTIILEDCVLRDFAFHQILTACKAIRQFGYTSGDEWVSEKSFSSRRVGRELEKHASALEALHFNVAEAYFMEDNDVRYGRDPGPIGPALRSLHRLRSLHIDSRVLFGNAMLSVDPGMEDSTVPPLSTMLPCSLQELCLHCHWGRLNMASGGRAFNILAAFIANAWQEGFRHLEEVTILWYVAWPGSQDLQKITDAAERTRVKVTMRAGDLT